METAADDNISLRVASFSCYLDTGKENLVHRVSAQETPIMINSGITKPATAKPPFNANISYSKDTKDSLTKIDSFSYLNTAGENFVFNIPGRTQDPPAAFSFSQGIQKDSEISIFGADKYFNMQLGYETGVKRASKKEGPLNLPQVGSNTRPRPPSLFSEASSWNSRAALMPNLQRNGSQNKQKKAIGRRIFSGFGCQGPCFAKRAVRVNELDVQEASCGSKPAKTGSRRIDDLVLVPVPNPGTENFTVKQQKQEIANLDAARNSIEVFGSGTTSKGDVATNMERKLSMLTWDAIPKGQKVPTSTVGSATICDDMASDASSDLFEIENISGSIYPALAADDMSSCMSPAYAPSEASIQWSVVTASAADYSSVLSDYNDEMSISVAGDKRSSKTRNGGDKEAQKGRPGGILGCKSHKAVDVAENVCHKANAKHQGLDLPVPLGKSQASRARVTNIETLQLSRPFSPAVAL